MIRCIEVAEQADEAHPVAFLALDELALEQLDQNVALAGMQGVLAQLQHVAAIGGLRRRCESAGQGEGERERVG
jgi:hypothetical protein